MVVGVLRFRREAYEASSGAESGQLTFAFLLVGRRGFADVVQAAQPGQQYSAPAGTARDLVDALPSCGGEEVVPQQLAHR